MDVGILTLHGMGKDKEHSHERMVENIGSCLSEEISLFVEPVMYYKEMQENQGAMLGRMGHLGLSIMRDFVISSLGDVATIGYNYEAYAETMSSIELGVARLRRRLSKGSPIVVVAQSLGCQVFSSYIWDEQANDIDYSDIRRLFTTGCNIPIFVSGVNESDIIPFAPTCEDFKWVNFWARTDVLGYPLQQLCPAYNELVEDVKVWSFMPILSHLVYNEKPSVYERIAQEISDICGVEMRKRDDVLNQM